MNKFTGLFEKALIYAVEKHQGQYRKSSNLPYIWHPISVAKNIEENKKSKNIELLMTAALLHDLVEDVEEITIEEIRKHFGSDVADIVLELTSDKGKIKEVGKTEYLKQKMVSMTSYALCIKLSDRLDNIRDLSTSKPEFREKYKKQTLEIIDFISDNRKLTSTHQKLIDKINVLLIHLN